MCDLGFDSALPPLFLFCVLAEPHCFSCTSLLLSLHSLLTFVSSATLGVSCSVVERPLRPLHLFLAIRALIIVHKVDICNNSYRLRRNSHFPRFPCAGKKAIWDHCVRRRQKGRTENTGKRQQRRTQKRAKKRENAACLLHAGGGGGDRRRDGGERQRLGGGSGGGRLVREGHAAVRPHLEGFSRHWALQNDRFSRT